MTSVFDVVSDGKEYFLRELEDELKGTLHCIAHAGENNLPFLRENQKYYEREYGSKIRDKSNQVSFNALGLPADFILTAYQRFMFMEKDLSNEEIEEEAENILGEYLEIPPLDMLDEETQREILEDWGKILDV